MATTTENEVIKLEDKLRITFSKAKISLKLVKYFDFTAEGSVSRRSILMLTLIKSLLENGNKSNQAIAVITNKKIGFLEKIILRNVADKNSFVIFIGLESDKNVRESYKNVLKKAINGGSATNNFIKDVSIAGQHVTPQLVPKKKILAVITAYNEDDIIEQTVRHLHSEGIDVHVVDNWSTDKTADIVKSISEENDNVTMSRWPSDGNKKAKDEFALKEVLKNEIEVIQESKGFDWVIHYDADEIRVSPWRDLNLQEAISLVDAYGYNAIDFTLINFRPTKNGFRRGVNPQRFFRYFEYSDTSGGQVQVKCWKNQQDKEIDLISSYGHQVQFEGRKVFPLKFLLKHYPLRSKKHAERKILSERIPRFSKLERSGGAHSHYDKIAEERKFLWDEKELLKFDHKYYKKDLFERLFGIII